MTSENHSMPTIVILLMYLLLSPLMLAVYVVGFAWSAVKLSWNGGRRDAYP